MKVRLGLVGLGYLGKIHLNCIKQVSDIDFVGCHDLQSGPARELCEQHQLRYFESLDELLSECDAIDIVTPTMTHFQIAEQAMKMGKHVFIEKPVTSLPAEAEAPLNLQRKMGVKAQIGHVERYNPAFLAVKPFLKNVRFIEAHRLSSFNPRGTDVSVVHDLMIHDLDLISWIAGCDVKSIAANGVSIVSRVADICNARIEFANGLVCNVTASRISVKPMRKIRVFQDDAYISMDLMTKETQIITMGDEAVENSFEVDSYRGKKYISIQNPVIPDVNAIREEIQSFCKSIVNNTETEVKLEDGLRALTLVDSIVKQIEAEQ